MINIEDDARISVYKFIDEHCIFRANPDICYFENFPKGSIIPSDYDKKMSWCFYLSRLIHDSRMLHCVGFNMGRQILMNAVDNKEEPNIQLCGLESSSYPIIAAIQIGLNQAGIHTNAFTIRKNRKPYGLGNFINGIPNHYPYVIIDDMIGSGSSARKIFDLCKHELNLYPAKNAYCIVKKMAGDYINFDETNKTRINYIFEATEFDFKYDPAKYWLPPDCDTSLVKNRDH